jgi:hypothetical protein
MTWRAFFIGILFVAAIALVEPWCSFGKGWGGFSGSSFPGGAVLVLVVLAVGLNLLLKLIRRGWELKQAELMLVWCMLIVAATFPGDGIARFWFSFTAAGPYMARRADLAWEEDGSLTHAPEGLVLSNSPKSTAAEHYYTGSERGVPWSYWKRPLINWTIFFVVMYLAIFCLMSILRRQWVESERLMFPLARVPLEFTEERPGKLLPGIFYEKGFLVGLIIAASFRLLRALPLFFGGESTVALTVPLRDIFLETPLEPMSFDNIDLWPSAVGFAFLVPADVSLSVWFFYWVARCELLAANWVGWGQHGGTYGNIMQWQQVGAYVAFAVAMLFMARRHLLAVARKALGMNRGLDDSGEPVPYGIAFWGLVLALGGCIAWYMVHGMRLLTAVAVFSLIMCWYLVYARMVAQAGLYVGRTIWRLPEVVHGLSGGRLFTPAGAVTATIQDTLLVTGGTAFLAPMAINAFRISEVFERRKRRLLVPILMFAFLVALVCGTWSALDTAYGMGASSMSGVWAQQNEPRWRFDTADRIIKQPGESARAYPAPLAIGVVSMGVLTFLRARFYWWPIHPIGLLTCSSWHAHRLWLPFLLGWLTKVCIMKFSGGRVLREARLFFIALIIVETFVGGVSTIVRILTDGAVPGF